MITFHALDIVLPSLDVDRVRTWIVDVVELEGFRVGELHYYFCGDDTLLNINRERLGHDFYTDIVTFPLGLEGGVISSEFVISVDRIADNAEQLGRTFEEELHRVIIHGVLHLVGFDDLTDEDRKKMRSQEDKCLKILFK